MLEVPLGHLPRFRSALARTGCEAVALGSLAASSRAALRFSMARKAPGAASAAAAGLFQQTPLRVSSPVAFFINHPFSPKDNMAVLEEEDP